jgi:hypothetical protein
MPGVPFSKGRSMAAVVQEESKALELFRGVMSLGIDGQGPLKSSRELAEEYLSDPRYASHEERLDALVRWETTKNFTTGFATGLGGLLTLPVSVPAGIGTAWIIQARMVATIAEIRGYDVTDDRVRTLAMAALLGDATVKEVLKDFGVKFSQRAGKAAARKIPGQVFIAINKKIGFRLLTKAGSKGLINVTKVVPVLGGVVGGTVDAASCRAVAHAARRAFPPITEDRDLSEAAHADAGTARFTRV